MEHAYVFHHLQKPASDNQRDLSEKGCAGVRIAAETRGAGKQPTISAGLQRFLAYASGPIGHQLLSSLFQRPEHGQPADPTWSLQAARPVFKAKQWGANSPILIRYQAATHDQPTTPDL